ncbi:NAD(P)/FAD-dependent oxidoreductase [Panacibacter ginsenosidivorans]|uniref:NADH:ubiquinone reductase (non-electrogenic) n=1 Tax=Panacibacter ginsenosidivorans TaxID=1813871 RepID=A0A5B8VHV9_9BACT|nr:NAD(P)/FAD-dependent oxidoreductase [Panacibacter ginsenosidivorans]QEC69868.1 NAD(P)/FAD-dependent oxidoreductase [Panacibacter ginsenosidivorans]
MKVIIIGGGFAGLKLARRLNNKEDIEVTLIDKNNYHQFQPLFYQVATAGLDASNISFPLRKAFQGSKNVHVRLAEVKEIQTANNKIVTDIGDFDYDRLVIATGADTNFFGNDVLKENAFPMKSTVEALQLRNRLIQNFEDALLVKDKDPQALQRMMTIVVVGGGPTGVEVSGALAEMRNNILPKDYPDLDFKQMKIYLVEGSPKTLGAMSEKSSEQSLKYLKELGVEVITQTVVKSYDGTNALLSNGESIGTKIVIWAAGIKGNVPAGIDASLIVRGNRIKVDRTNKIIGSENVYAIGDISYMETPLYPHGHPQVANVAINQAKNLAVNLIRQVTGNKHYQDEFEYKDKGSMATVGKHKAVVDIPKPKIHFGGWLAWMVWMGLHLVLIVGVKNRLQIFVNWIYKYFTSDQSLRLLFRISFRPVKRDVDIK